MSEGLIVTLISDYTVPTVIHSNSHSDTQSTSRQIITTIHNGPRDENVGTMRLG